MNPEPKPRPKPELKSEPGPNGHLLKYQEMKHDPSKIRAVIIDALDDLVARGPVVDIYDWEQTRDAAIANFNIRVQAREFNVPTDVDSSASDPKLLRNIAQKVVEELRASPIRDEERWTKPREDGQPHKNFDPVQCNHCNHVYPNGFDLKSTLEHCREAHPEFYRRKWVREIIPSGQASLYAAYAPKSI